MFCRKMRRLRKCQKKQEEQEVLRNHFLAFKVKITLWELKNIKRDKNKTVYNERLPNRQTIEKKEMTENTL